MPSDILRFAPSPTGMLHVGNLRAALLNFLYARKNHAKFILRIDDTDQERSTKEFTNGIIDDLNWLDISWDESFSQSSRQEYYEQALLELESRGLVYKCYETKEELDIKRKILLSQKRPPVYDRASIRLTQDDHARMADKGVPYYWRFKLDQEHTTWTDMIHGEISIDTASISDPVIKKTDGGFVYLLASVVDDIASGITHIIRGDDHISNTAVQLQMFKALSPNFRINFGHYPLLQSIDGDEFSKRHNSMSIRWFRESGVEPMSLNSILAKIGSSDPVRPCATMDQLVESFDISKISRARPKFDANDVFKVNRKILAQMKYNDISKLIQNDLFSSEIWDIIKENVDKKSDIDVWCDHIAGGRFDTNLNQEDRKFIALCAELLIDGISYDEWINSVKTASGRSKYELYHPIRIALTGYTNGPELRTIFTYLKPTKVRERLDNAV